MKQLSTLPIVVLSAATDIEDKVVLLELGADDYVTKPFSPKELLARVRTAIRHTRKSGVRDLTTFDGVCVDLARMEVTFDGQPVKRSHQPRPDRALVICAIATGAVASVAATVLRIARARLRSP